LTFAKGNYIWPFSETVGKREKRGEATGKEKQTCDISWSVPTLHCPTSTKWDNSKGGWLWWSLGGVANTGPLYVDCV